MNAWDAIIVAGGAGRRLGGASKPDLMVAGATLLARTLDAVSGAHGVVVVGGPRQEGVAWTVEDPPGSGPAAAVAAGVAVLSDGAALTDSVGQWTVVLGVDTPLAADAVARLLAALAVVDDAPDGATSAHGADGAWLVDAEGREQPLLAVYRTDVLAARCEGNLADASLRRLTHGLDMIAVPDVEGLSRDLDTWDDARFWKEQLG